MKKIFSTIISSPLKGRLCGLLFALLATTTLWAYDFQSGDLYYNITSDTTVEVTYQYKWSYDNYAGLTTATIPETVTYNSTTYSVTSIGEYAFQYCSSSLTSVTIGNSVTNIGFGAFRNCFSLTSVTIGNSVTSIRDYVFDECSSLTSVTLNSNDIVSKEYTKTLNMHHIFGSHVEEYVIGDSVTSIGDYAFYDCSSLTSVTIGNSVTSIGGSAFYHCSSLTSVTIGNSLTSIGDYAFYDCSSLTSVTIPNSVTSIGGSAFRSCSSLTSVTIGNSVTSIGERAFYGCSSLTSITIPNSVTSIGDEAFGWCSSLTSITIPNSVTSIGREAFYHCSSLTSVTIGNSVTNIGFGAFMMTSLTSVTLTGSTIESFCQSTTNKELYYAELYYVDGEAYHYDRKIELNNQEINDLIIPNSVTSIEDYAFYNCSSLTSITFEAITPPIIGEYAFSGVSRSIPVYVPCGTVSVYNAAWSAFSNIQEPLAEYSITVSVNDSIMGSANVDRNSICGNQISATPNFGYHFVQWSDGSTENPRTLTLTRDTILTAEFAQTISGQCGNSLYWNYEAQNNLLSITGTDGMYNYETSTNTAGMLTCAEARDIASESNYQGTENVTIYGYVTNIVNSKYDSNTSRYKQCFHMSDTKNGGNTFYAYWAFVPNYFSVGDKVTLTGKLKNYNGTEEIVDGEAAHFVDMPNNPTPWLLLTNSIKEIIIENGATSIGANAFNGCSEINKITLSNSLQSIGRNAFSGCASIKDVTLPASVKTIGENAFAGCTKLYDIYCFAMEPPTAYESSFANYNAFLHVPCDNQRVYLLDVIFGNFKYIECIEAETTPTDTVVVTPSFNDAEFIWPSNSSADSYTLAISKDGEVFCTLTFNAAGQLTGIAFAPSRNGQRHAPAATQAANGFTFTVTGLEEGTDYSYNLVIKDNSGKTLQTYSGEFRTQSTNDRTVTVEYDAAQGQVTGAGTYLVGDTVTLTAIPNDGYRFVRWSNEVEDNPYTFVISDNVTLSAEFEEVITTSVENATPSQQSDTHKLLRNGQLLIIRDGKTYNIMGAEIK